MADKMLNYSPEDGRGIVGMSSRDERLWSSLAHLSIFADIVTGFLGPVIALVIWLVYRDRSEKVAFQAMQAFWYQIAWIVVLAVGWTVTGLLMAVLIGFLLVPVMIVATVFPFAHSAYAAYKVNNGEDFRYPLIADLIEGR